IFAVIDLLLHLFSLNTGNKIRIEGAIKLFEALKSNSSLITLDLSSNRPVASFHHSHSIQRMILAVKELSNYLKHLNQMHLSLRLISAVADLLPHFIPTQYRY